MRYSYIFFYQFFHLILLKKVTFLVVVCLCYFDLFLMSLHVCVCVCVCVCVYKIVNLYYIQVTSFFTLVK